MALLRFNLHRGGVVEARDVVIDTLVIAGWTGRDAAAVQHHVDELAAIGVPPPSKVPLYYRVATSLLTQADAIEVVGAATSGEGEPVLFATTDGLWLTLGSDHTDRDAERAGVALSKQLCSKPVARVAWAWKELADRVDAIALDSRIVEGGAQVAYQRGTLVAIRPLASLARGFAPEGLAPGSMMFGGTLPAIGGVRAAPAFAATLRDTVVGRSIELVYRIEALPTVT